MSLSEDLQAVAKSLLEEGAVDVVIGCGKGTLPLRSTPIFVRSAEDADGLVFDATCGANLVRYLHGRPDRAGVVVKACDARTLVEAIKEKQLDPEKVVAITVPCEGVVDADAVIRALGAPELLAAGLDGTEVKVTTREGEKTLALDEILCERCRSCDVREPVIPEGIGITVERVGGEAASPSAERAAALVAFEAKSPEERWEWLAGEASKCVLCYACRSACPMIRQANRPVICGASRQAKARRRCGAIACCATCR